MSSSSSSDDIVGEFHHIDSSVHFDVPKKNKKSTSTLTSKLSATATGGSDKKKMKKLSENNNIQSDEVSLLSFHSDNNEDSPMSERKRANSSLKQQHLQRQHHHHSLQVPFPRKENAHSPRTPRGSASTRSPTKDKEGGDKNDSGSDSDSDSDSDILTELSINDVVIQSKFKGLPVDEQMEQILSAYNYDVMDSCFVYHVLPGRSMNRIPPNCFLLAHRNQVMELADPKGQRVALKINPDPMVVMNSFGPVLKNTLFFGNYGKYVLNVPPGYFAKAMSRNQPILFSEGPHVIVDTSFIFNEKTGLVDQNDSYINHHTIHIVMVPAGMIAKAWLGTTPIFLESRKETYVFNSPQFKLVSENKRDGTTTHFFPATERYVEHGSLKRLIPHTGEAAIVYDNGILDIIYPSTSDAKPIVLNSETLKFEGFITTSMQTVIFPSEKSKRHVNRENPKATQDEKNLKIFQTRDSLRIGIELVVAYQIVQPEVAITKLGLDGIVPHIENVSFADMGKAIQLCTLQEVMFSSQNISQLDNQQHHSLSIQDQVKKNLAKDLKDFGIKLVRLNIETMKVIDKEISKKLARNSIISAEYTTKQSMLVKQYEIQMTEARMQAETNSIMAAQKNLKIVSDAEAMLEAAKLEREAFLIHAESVIKAAQLEGSIYEKYPALWELKMAEVYREAMKDLVVVVKDVQELENMI